MRCIELTFVVPFPCRTSALCRCLREICITPFWLAVSEHRFTTTTTTIPANAWISMSNDELMIWYDRIQYNRFCWLWCNFSSILKNPCIHCFDAYRYDWFQWFCVILSVARASNSMSLLRLFSISFFLFLVCYRLYCVVRLIHFIGRVFVLLVYFIHGLNLVIWTFCRVELLCVVFKA